MTKTITYDPDLWVLVPREATEEMCSRVSDDELYDADQQWAANVYRAMLAAAPQPTAGEAGQDAKDAQRYRWLRERLDGADFAYGSPPRYVLTFEMPDDFRASANLDAAIDAAIKDAASGAAAVTAKTVAHELSVRTLGGES